MVQCGDLIGQRRCAMCSSANDYPVADADVQFPIVDVSDDALERMSEGDQRHAVNTAFCTQWWICPA